MSPMCTVTPLEPWIARRIGLAVGPRPTPDRLATFQLERLNAVLAAAARHSQFYHRLWGGAAPRMNSLDDLQRLPFTTESVLRSEPLQFLAVPQAEIARVVTLRTSGTTGDPKRIHFSDGDLADTLSFFRHGMASLVEPGQRVMILLPGDLPDSVGDLLRRALADMDVTGIVHGLVTDPAAAVRAVRDQGIDTLVGIPVQVMAMARQAEVARPVTVALRGVLLTTDHVPPPLVEYVGQVWGCKVFQHYGMTEMGYGGAVSCSANDGYHLRESDLLFEIVDPMTGLPLGPGHTGEVVFTTLTRRAMPLIRYRTGDLAAWIDAPCPCGSVLRRMGWVQGRRKGAVLLAGGTRLTMADLDNVLFPLPGVVNFLAHLRRKGPIDRLYLTLFMEGAIKEEPEAAVLRALSGVPSIRAAMATGALEVSPIDIKKGCGPLSASAAKRTITVITDQS